MRTAAWPCASGPSTELLVTEPSLHPTPVHLPKHREGLTPGPSFSHLNCPYPSLPSAPGPLFSPETHLRPPPLTVIKAAMKRNWNVPSPRSTVSPTRHQPSFSSHSSSSVYQPLHGPPTRFHEDQAKNFSEGGPPPYSFLCFSHPDSWLQLTHQGLEGLPVVGFSLKSHLSQHVAACYCSNTQTQNVSLGSLKFLLSNHSSNYAKTPALFLSTRLGIQVLLSLPISK